MKDDQQQEKANYGNEVNFSSCHFLGVSRF